jgi:hypothetical protein
MYCWVKKGDKLERRPLVIGMTNNSFIEIKDGVAEGEQVVLNPRAVVAEARDEGGAQQERVDDARARFGTAAPEAGGAAENGGSPPGAERKGRGEPGSEDLGGPRRERGGMRREPAAQGPGSPGGERGPAERRGGGPGGGGSSGRMNLMDNDKDGDGKISREEAPERMRDFFDRLDTNGDGFIDAAEIAAMRSRSGSRGGPGAGGPEGGRRGEGGPQ